MFHIHKFIEQIGVAAGVGLGPLEATNSGAKQLIGAGDSVLVEFFGEGPAFFALKIITDDEGEI